MNNEYNSNYNPTIEDSYIHEISSNGITQTIEVLDTSGYYQFPAMRDLSIRSASGILFVFDISDPTTLDDLVELHKVVIQIKGESRIPLFLVGNKCDIKINQDQLNKINDKAHSIASYQFQCEYLEVSAKENTNVDKIFSQIIDHISRHIEISRDLLSLHSNLSSMNSRRSSSMSYSRRMSVSAKESFKINDASRRYSEPMKDDEIKPNNIKNNEKSNDNKPNSKEVIRKKKKKLNKCTIS
jgi:small GTP-binding protein